MAMNVTTISEAIAAGSYPGLELDNGGDVTLLVTVPGNVAAHYRRVNAQPKETLEMSLADVSEEQFQLPVRVSATRLSSASGKFRALFTQMTEQYHADASGAGSHGLGGHQIIGLRSYDGLSCLIILIAIYGRQGLLPQAISPILLVRIAAKTNQHDCAEATAPIFRPYISQAMKEYCIPNTVNRNLEVWLMIASTFQHLECFAEATRTFIASSREIMLPQHIPLPQHLYDRMNANRAENIGQLINQLHGFYDFLSREGCLAVDERNPFRRHLCTHIVICALTHHMHRAGLIYPSPAAPFSGISLLDLWRFINEKTSPELDGHPNCNLQTRMVKYFQGMTIEYLSLDALRAPE
ncbi:hypothetical protein BJY00DRAFT_62876 [Aspergillus carlsbadensis]|nr:hypothetical protein BJY00DRAFT_62876 [Aspergillus carlsbadensis]